VGDMMPDAARHLGWTQAVLVERRFWIALFMVVFVIPLSFLQKMDHLKFTSFLSLGFVVYMVVGKHTSTNNALLMLLSYCEMGVDGTVVLLYDTVDSLDPCSGHDDGDACVGPTENAIAGVGTLRVLPIFVFGYSCHANLFNINNELKDNTAARKYFR
jgi:amino acid permease